ncbi:MAG: Hsp20/alpha crystallin family protein [Actinomycetota bacterium]|nr:Hsp20/alpha crystallin family protein [Actinomycetota bacterium]
MAIVRWTNPFLPATYREWFPRGFLLSDLAEFPLRSEHFVPRMDIYSEDADVMVKMDLPEFKAEDVDVSVEESCLTISGKSEHEEKVEEKDYYRRERYSGAFTRTVQLPPDVKEEDISADLKDGILEVRIKGAAEKASAVTGKKKIAISSS